MGVDIVCVTTGVIVVSFSGLILFCLGSISGSCFMTSGSPSSTRDGAVVGSCMRIGGFFLLKSGIKTGALAFSFVSGMLELGDFGFVLSSIACITSVSPFSVGFSGYLSTVINDKSTWILL